MPAAPSQDVPLILHASCVAVGRRAALIRGASGSGKSSLALELMALGARLVADDRTGLYLHGGNLVAKAPGAIAGMIEARGVGILRADPAPPTPVALIVDMDKTEAERLPKERSDVILGQRCPLLHKVDTPHFTSAILQYLKSGPWKQI